MTAAAPAATQSGRMAVFANVNSRSLSLASISSEGSCESHTVEQEDIIALTQDVRSFKDVLSRLRKVYSSPDADSPETLRVTSHERLSDVLKILRHILEKYPAIQSHDLVTAAGHLIKNVKALNRPREEFEEPFPQEPREFFEALDGLALAFSSRVSEYLMGDLGKSSFCQCPFYRRHLTKYGNLGLYFIYNNFDS
jgi:hypothetical protein